MGRNVFIAAIFSIERDTNLVSISEDEGSRLPTNGIVKIPADNPF